MVGAEVMVLPSTYPAAPATTHPTASPTMILAFFKNGEPNSSVIMMVTNERNPRPMNSGEPHLSDKIRNLNTTPKTCLTEAHAWRWWSGTERADH